ncbi:MAG: alpha-amylase family glycosyl hydrolase [Candidatus Limnocylindrales bacterium]
MARRADWWQRAVVYQIYPRSFADTDGDGVGDLPGVIAHLDHLRGAPDSLDVDAIWLSPIYPSPGLDLGYDVADHSAVDPLLGTLDDALRLIEEAHRRGLAVILDLVLNHTSDRHAWFQASRASRSGPEADWYIWHEAAGRDRRGRPRPPNNWVSFFGGSAWTWEPAREQFYLHTFLAQQPDVNWRAPGLREAQLQVVRTWLGRGVDGFRLDTFNCFFKHPDLPDNPRAGFALRGWDRQRHVFDKDQPELLEFLAGFRALLDEAGAVSVGELFSGDPSLAARYTAPGHLVFDFRLLEQPWDARALARAIDEREAAFGSDRWPTTVLSNHDQRRHASRLAQGVARDSVARAAAVLLLGLRGTPFLYYGEELGLGDIRVPPWRIVDPPARHYWPFPVWWNRDGCRAPMPWHDGPGAGFTSGRPWLPLPADWRTRNVAREATDPTSVLALYRRLLHVRQGSGALQVGDFAWHIRGDDGVLAWLRRSEGQTALVALNTGPRPATLGLPREPGPWRSLISTAGPEEARAGLTGELELGPLEARILVPTAQGQPMS